MKPSSEWYSSSKFLWSVISRPGMEDPLPGGAAISRPIPQGDGC